MKLARMNCEIQCAISSLSNLIGVAMKLARMNTFSARSVASRILYTCFWYKRVWFVFRTSRRGKFESTRRSEFRAVHVLKPQAAIRMEAASLDVLTGLRVAQ